MKNFTYYTPTKVVFGKKAELSTGSLLKEFGAKKVLVHYGQGSVIKSGLLGRILKILDDEGIPYVTLGGVVANPHLDLVYKGIDLCRKEGVDFILAVGGGSVADSAKAIAYGAVYEGDVWDFYLRKDIPKAALGVGVVMTLAATGSEMSNSTVITNEKNNLKRSCTKLDLARPRFAVMDPELTFTLPEYQTMSGCVDIIMHTFERFFSQDTDTELTDELALAVIKTVMHNAKILLKEPENYNARAEVFWAGSLSHNGLTGCGRDEDWACHQLEHELSGMFDVAHGAGLAAVWGSWARYVYKDGISRFTKLGEEALGIPYDKDDPERCALCAIEAMEDFFRQINMPVKISDMGIDLDDRTIDELAWNCSFENTRTIGALKVLDIEDMKNIYRMAR